MPYFKIQIDHGASHKPAEAVIRAPDLQSARTLGIERLGLIDPPGMPSSADKVQVGEASQAEWIAAEAKRQGVRPEDVIAPE